LNYIPSYYSQLVVYPHLPKKNVDTGNILPNGLEKEGKIMKLTIEVKAKPGKANELYQTLHALLTTMRKHGCQEGTVSQNVEDGEIFSLSGVWDALSLLEAFIQSGSGIALLGAIDLLGKSGRVRLGSDAPWEGVEALKRMRKEA
jgi:quinol monooxygenase YgiN